MAGSPKLLMLLRNGLLLVVGGHKLLLVGELLLLLWLDRLMADLDWLLSELHLLRRLSRHRLLGKLWLSSVDWLGLLHWGGLSKLLLLLLYYWFRRVVGRLSRDAHPPLLSHSHPLLHAGRRWRLQSRVRRAREGLSSLGKVAQIGVVVRDDAAVQHVLYLALPLGLVSPKLVVRVEVLLVVLVQRVPAGVVLELIALRFGQELVEGDEPKQEPVWR